MHPAQLIVAHAQVDLQHVIRQWSLSRVRIIAGCMLRRYGLRRWLG